MTAMSDDPKPAEPTVWQEPDGWHVRARKDGPVHVFKTRDEAISFSASTPSDGASSARAATQRGEVAQHEVKTEHHPPPR